MFLVLMTPPKRLLCIVVGLVVVFSVLGVLWWAPTEERVLTSSVGTTVRRPTGGDSAAPQPWLKFTCPPQDDHTVMNDETSFYTDANALIRDEWPWFVASLFNADASDYAYDGWEVPYATVRAAMHDWKVNQWKAWLDEHSKQLPPIITIYESAAGMGLNLLQTVQALHETSKEAPRTVVLAANEWVPDSVALAHDLRAVFPAHTQWGPYCTANSQKC